LNTSLTVAVSQDMEENKTVNDPKYQKKSDRLAWSVTPKADYGFSSKVTGGTNIIVSQDKERVSDQTHNHVEVGIWAQISF
jgi:hypothetical protein